MAVTVKKIALCRGEVENKPGVLAKVLGPLAEAGADLQVVMGYHYHGAGNKAVIEVYPVSGKKATDAASKAGLAASPFPRCSSRATTGRDWAVPSPKPSPKRGSTSGF